MVGRRGPNSNTRFSNPGTTKKGPRTICQVSYIKDNLKQFLRHQAAEELNDFDVLKTNQRTIHIVI